VLLAIAGLSRKTRPDLWTEPRGVVDFEVMLGVYVSLLSMAATGPVLLVSLSLAMEPSER